MNMPTILRIILSLLLLSLLFLSTGCGVLGSKNPVVAPESPKLGGIEVFFATDRAQSSKPAEIFGGGRGDISFGVAQVGIPPNHKMGKHESPSLLKFEWSPDEHKHIKIRSVDHLAADDFVTLLREAVKRSPGKEIMIFVHGYNVDFREGARLLGQFAHDLKFEGPVVLFSWPSQGSLTGYTMDQANAQYSTRHFAQLLKKMLQYTPAEGINLVAHSMGNRILVHGLLDVANDLPPNTLRLFKEIVMIAPDLDANVFEHDLAPKLIRTNIPVTLYASSNDRAILASKMVHGHPRLGDAGENLVVVDGLETIDASNVSARALGHSYFAEDPRIMADLFALFKTGKRADRRFGLAPKVHNGASYWTLRE